MKVNSAKFLLAIVLLFIILTPLASQARLDSSFGGICAFADATTTIAGAQETIAFSITQNTSGESGYSATSFSLTAPQLYSDHPDYHFSQTGASATYALDGNYTGFHCNGTFLSQTEVGFRLTSKITGYFDSLNLYGGTISIPLYLSGKSNSSAFVLEPSFSFFQAQTTAPYLSYIGNIGPNIPFLFSTVIGSTLFYKHHLFLQYGYIAPQIDTASADQLISGTCIDMAALYAYNFTRSSCFLTPFVGALYCSGDFSGTISQKYGDIFLSFPYLNYSLTGSFNMWLLATGTFASYTHKQFKCNIATAFLYIPIQSCQIHEIKTETFFLFFTKTSEDDISYDELAQKAYLPLSLSGSYSFSRKSVSGTVTLARTIFIPLSFADSDGSSKNSTPFLENKDCATILLSGLSLSVRLSIR